ncbi:MAG TPA: ATPase [Acidobacteriaceae bacterium]
MNDEQRPTMFCISTYEKGQAFLREAARLGCDVVLLTVDKLRDADWPKDALAEFHTMPAADVPERQAQEQVRMIADSVARRRKIARVVALDEFDLESAASLREHLRLPGMGLTAIRFFRDKLAMRMGARAAGVAVPEFSGVFNDAALSEFMGSVEGPWLLKPRWNASAIGIRKIERPEDLWPALDSLGALRTHHLLERFVPGEIFHVEGVTWGGEVLFAAPHKYGQPPMQTMQEGGVFTTRALDRASEDAAALRMIHRETLAALGMKAGVTHSEFIKARADGKFYFLETAARVGGAYIAETVEFATGLNPWVEWARIEVAALRGEEYSLPSLREDYSGSVISLARQEWPDTAAYDAPEVVYRLHKNHHAGLIVRSGSAERVEQLLDEYGRRFLVDFYARLDAPDKPTA